jgi:SAM-dependent methyltransferase
MDGWLLDELALAGPEHVDPAAVECYEQKAGFDPAPELELLRELGLDHTSTLVDLGAGTGVFARAAARVAARVVAVDVSPAMVEAMRSNPSGIEVVEAGLLTYDHRGPAADFVYSRNVLHHLPDFWKAIALARVTQILRRGGVLRLRDLVYSFDPADAARYLEAFVASGAEIPADGWTQDELAAHVADEHSTFSWLLEEMLQRAGFELEDVQYDESKIFAAYVAVRR